MNSARTRVVMALLFLLAAQVTHADGFTVQAFSRDAVAVGLLLGDVQTTKECQQYYPTCFETNPILGRHPSNTTIYSYNSGVAAGLIVLNHLLPRFTRHSNVLLWIGTAALTGIEIRCIRGNIRNFETGSQLKQQGLP